MTILDYYGLAFALGVIVISSEPFPFGLLWTAAFCLLGSPFACLYVVYRLIYQTTQLVDYKLPQGGQKDSIELTFGRLD